MTQPGLEKKRALSGADLDQIRELVETCNRVDNLSVKFNWSMMAHREPGHVNDLCYYDDSQLVGYMPLDAFGDEFEITALVLPSHRRQGIFRRLYEAARQEARCRQAKQLLLVNYRASEPGKAVVQRWGLAYDFSEYRMEADVATMPPLPVSQIQLEEVKEANVRELSRQLALNFEATEWNTAPSLLKELERDDKRYYLARLGSDFIGHIGTVIGSGEVYVRAVGILPEWRRQGYGRQLLATLLRQLLSEGHTHFELDVETENRYALGLYQMCGFQETTVYDYYLVPLPEASGPVLETDRLLLRPMEETDVDALLSIFADPKVMAAFNTAPFNREQMQGWMQRNLQHQSEHGYGLFSVILKSEGVLIGDCGLEQMAVEGMPVVELGYDFRSDYWNQGYATEAATAVRDYAFQTLQLPEVISLIRASNQASRRVAEKIGMHLREEIVRYDTPYWKYAVKRP